MTVIGLGIEEPMAHWRTLVELRSSLKEMIANNGDGRYNLHIEGTKTQYSNFFSELLEKKT